MWNSRFNHCNPRVISRFQTLLSLRRARLALLFHVAALFVMFHWACPTLAQDSWPQWGGPNRDHKSLAKGLLQEWNSAGPQLLWTFTHAGRGFSAPAVVDGKAFTLGSIDAQSHLICIDTVQGTQLWRTAIAADVAESEYNHGWGGGPRSTPTVAGNRVVALDDGGNLVCVEKSSGSIQWKVNLVNDFGGRIPKWGYSESPLVDGDRVVVCPGGSQFLVTLELATGKKVFSSKSFEKDAHYVSVVKHSVGGIDSYISATEAGLVAFSAKNGEVLWTNGSSGNGTATIPTPILKDNLVYHTSNYGAGCVLLDVKANNGELSASEVYANKVIVNHHGGVVLVDNTIFGLKRNGGFVCQDFKSGELRWNYRLSGDDSAAVAYADGRLYVFGDGTGSCYLVEPSDKEWLERGKLKLPKQSDMPRLKGKIWTHPVIAEGKLFLRDLDLMFAFEIKKK
jgi:outer membrane protein assembly factor BamB